MLVIFKVKKDVKSKSKMNRGVIAVPPEDTDPTKKMQEM